MGLLEAEICEPSLASSFSSCVSSLGYLWAPQVAHRVHLQGSLTSMSVVQDAQFRVIPICRLLGLSLEFGCSREKVGGMTMQEEAQGSQDQRCCMKRREL